MEKYSILTGVGGKKKISFGYSYLPSINFAEVLKSVAKEFPNIPAEKLEIKVEGEAWYCGGGSFCITVREI